MSLYDALSKISEDVIQHRDKMNSSEATTVQVSVKPFFQKLGFDTHDPDEISEQFDILGDAVDFAILQDGEPIIVLEAKKASESLSSKHWKQLLKYFNAATARIGILTNGILFAFYTDMKTRNIMDKEPFLQIDLLNLCKQNVDVLAGFTKTRFDAEKSVRHLKLLGLVEREFNHPSDNFVKHFAKQVHSGSVRQTVIDEYRPLVKRAIDKYADRTVAPPPPRPVPPIGYIPVFGYYEGHKFEAELLRNSINDGLTISGNQIRYNGETTWLKNAAVMAICSVNPSFKPTRTNPNGFTFWHVVDPADGKEHMIRHISGWDNITDEALRQRVLSS